MSDEGDRSGVSALAGEVPLGCGSDGRASDGGSTFIGEGVDALGCGFDDEDRGAAGAGVVEACPFFSFCACTFCGDEGGGEVGAAGRTECRFHSLARMPFENGITKRGWQMREGTHS